MSRKFIVGFALILGFIMPMTAFANTVGSCSITINANVHNGHQLAYGSGNCKQGIDGLGGVYGFYQDGSFWVSSDRLEQVKNGQVLKNRYVTGVGYMDIHVTTIPLKQSEPKPAPKPEPKPQPAPKPTPKPKDPPKQPAPKPQSKETPKTNTPKPSTPKSSSSKATSQKSPSSTSSTSQSQKSTPKQSTAQKQTTNTSSKQSTTQKKQNTQQKQITAKEVSNLTVQDLKEKGAKVEEKAGKLFATVDGVSKEITKDEAKELGYEVEVGEEEIINEEIEEKEDKLVEESKKDEEPKKKSFLPYLLGGLGLGVPTLGALGYAYFRRK